MTCIRLSFETHYTAQNMDICCVVVGFARANLNPIVRVCLPLTFNLTHVSLCKLIFISLVHAPIQ